MTCHRSTSCFVPLVTGLFVVILAVGQMPTVHAQDQTASVFPDGMLYKDVPGSFSSGSPIDSVSLLTGTVQYTIPLFSLKGRGLDTNLVFGGGSGGWHKVYYDYGYWDYEFSGIYGAGGGIGIPGFGGMSEVINSCASYDDYGDCTEYLYNVFYTVYGGETIQLGSLVQWTASNSQMSFAIPLDYPSSYNKVFTSGDGSYVVGDPTKGAIHFPDGRVSSGMQITDRNGNTIKCSGTVCIDTVGRNVYQYSGGLSGQTWSYRDSNGTVQSASYTAVPATFSRRDACITTWRNARKQP